MAVARRTIGEVPGPVVLEHPDASVTRPDDHDVRVPVVVQVRKTAPQPPVADGLAPDTLEIRSIFANKPVS